MDGQNDTFPAPKRIISLTDKVFTIRPYLAEDKVRLCLWIASKMFVNDTSPYFNVLKLLALLEWKVLNSRASFIVFPLQDVTAQIYLRNCCMSSAILLAAVIWYPRSRRGVWGLCVLVCLSGHLKPAFHGACFGAGSAPILSARVPLRASAAFEKERFHYEHSSCFHGRRLPR